MKIKELLEEIIEKAGTGEGSRGGKVVGHTASGKPIYYSAGNSNHKKFSKQDHADAALAHSSIRSRLSDEYHAQHNGDGTFSEKHRKRKAQLQKLI
ncbi:hypothetical protein EBR03_10075, partial [bacterium]|nr:hypothetical protein [bacterium]